MLPRSETASGTEELDVPPLPSCPVLLLPHAYAVPVGTDGLAFPDASAGSPSVAVASPAITTKRPRGPGEKRSQVVR